MKFLNYLIILTFLLSAACASTNKQLRKGKNSQTENAAQNDAKKTADSVTPIKEVEEKLVPNANVMPDPHRFFVIIGSFRGSENAQKYQEQISKEGFKSEILKNEEGLYRISVLSTDDVEAARNEIRRIRAGFPKYFDTWLLIQKK